MAIKSGAPTFGRKYQLILLVFIALGLNANTLSHDYALDDIVVMTENKYVQKGIKGIPEILCSDLMTGYSSKENLLSQPRYRPFSSIIFALEYEIWGAKPFVSHLINVLLFSLLIILLYNLLQKHVFREQDQHLAFFTCLIFAVHPVHTEVIANVKSRDELITFILLITSLTSLIRYSQSRSIAGIFTAVLCFFLAMLTRESAATFLGIAPLVLYFFFHQSLKKSIQFSIPLILAFAAYLLLRFAVIGMHKPIVTDILNAPYLYATPAQAFATKLFVIIKYMWIMVFPHPLSSDYSYNQIPYIDISSLKFTLSLLVLSGLAAYAIFTFKKKSLLSFSILYFFVTISLVSNFIIDIGTPFSERLLFQPSLGFCIALAFIFLNAYKKTKIPAALTMLVILVFFSMKTYSRNSEWKNNETLFMADVISAPNSARTTLYATEVYRMKAKLEKDPAISKEYYDKAALYGERSIKIHPTFAVTYLNLGFVYYYQFDYEKAATLWLKGYQLDPSDPEAKKCLEVLSVIYYKQGNGRYEQGELKDAIKRYRKSIELNAGNVEAWYNLGGIFFLLNDSNAGNEAWENVKKLDPGHLFNKEEFKYY